MSNDLSHLTPEQRRAYLDNIRDHLGEGLFRRAVEQDGEDQVLDAYQLFWHLPKHPFRPTVEQAMDVQHPTRWDAIRGEYQRFPGDREARPPRQFWPTLLAEFICLPGGIKTPEPGDSQPFTNSEALALLIGWIGWYVFIGPVFIVPHLGFSILIALCKVFVVEIKAWWFGIRENPWRLLRCRGLPLVLVAGVVLWFVMPWFVSSVQQWWAWIGSRA